MSPSMGNNPARAGDRKGHRLLYPAIHILSNQLIAPPPLTHPPLSTPVNQPARLKSCPWLPGTRSIKMWQSVPLAALPVLSRHSPPRPHTPASAAGLTSPEHSSSGWLSLGTLDPLVWNAPSSRLSGGKGFLGSRSPWHLSPFTPGSASITLDHRGQGGSDAPPLSMFRNQREAF